MEIKDLSEENFHYYYNREERLQLKRKKNEEKEKKRKFFGLTVNSYAPSIFVNMLFILLIVLLFQFLILPFFQDSHLTYKIKLKEMLFEDSLMIEVKLKSCSQETTSYLVWVENSLHQTRAWSGKLSISKEESLYFSLPKDEKLTYTVWVKKEEEAPTSLLRRVH